MQVKRAKIRHVSREEKDQKWIDPHGLVWNWKDYYQGVQRACQMHLLKDLTSIVLMYLHVPESHEFILPAEMDTWPVYSPFVQSDRSSLVLYSYDKRTMVTIRTPWIDPVIQLQKIRRDEMGTEFAYLYRMEHAAGPNDSLSNTIGMSTLRPCDPLVIPCHGGIWDSWFRLVFSHSKPRRAMCSSDGHIIAFWENAGGRVLVVKRLPDPHVIASFRVPGSFIEPYETLFSCDWNDQEQKGFLVALVNGTISCWSLPQETLAERVWNCQVVSDVEEEDVDIDQPQVSYQDRMIYLRVSGLTGSRLRVLAIPAF